jgi:hypothetical protein
MHVNLDTGETFVNINAVKTVYQVVKKAMEIVAAALPVSGELIVTRYAEKVAHQAVIKAVEIVAAAHPVSGVIIVTINACTIVPLQAVLD